MNDIMNAPFLVEMVRTTTNMYAHGWDERNGGNISWLLDEEQVAEYLDVNAVIRDIPTGFEAPALDGKYFIVTGTGKYFKNVQYDPACNLGVIRITDGGKKRPAAVGIHRRRQVHLRVPRPHDEPRRPSERGPGKSHRHALPPRQSAGHDLCP